MLFKFIKRLSCKLSKSRSDKNCGAGYVKFKEESNRLHHYVLLKIKQRCMRIAQLHERWASRYRVITDHPDMSDSKILSPQKFKWKFLMRPEWFYEDMIMGVSSIQGFFMQMLGRLS